LKSDITPLLADILDHPTDILAVVNPATLRIEGINKSFSERFAVSNETANGMYFLSFFPSYADPEKGKSIIEAIESRGLHVEKADANTHLLFTKLGCASYNTVLVRVDLPFDRMSKKNFQELIDKNVAGVFQTHIDGRLISCNEAFAVMMGYTSIAEMLLEASTSFYPNPGDRRSFLEDLESKIVLSNYEIKLKRRDGKIITCLENTFLDKDEEDRKVIRGTIIDISQQTEYREQLKESETRFRVLSSVSNEGVVFVNNENIQDANDQFAKIFGYRDRQEIIGQKITSFFSAIDVNRMYTSIQISQANRLEVRTFSNDGQALFLDVSGSESNLHGKQVRVLVVSDVTARRKTEYTLEQTVVRLKNLLENSPSAVIILTEERIKYANSAAIQLFGVSEEDDIYDKSFHSFVSAEYRKAIKDDLRAIRQGVVVEYKEIRIKNSKGTEVDVGIKSTLTVYENKPSIQISLNDISERMMLVQEQMRIRIIEEINTVLKKEIEEHKITQQKLQAQENYTRNLIQSSLDMIMASDHEGNVTEFNRAAEEQFGYSKSEVMRRNFRILYKSKEDYNRVLKTIAKEGKFIGEIQNVRKSGEVFTSLLSVAQIISDTGEVMGSMGVSRDITVLRENERLMMEQKAKLESIFNSTENIMMWTMDRDHKITTVNRNFKHWLEEQFNEEIDTKTQITSVLKRHIDENQYQGQLTSFDNAFSGRAQQFEFPLRHPNGKALWLQVFLNPVYMGEKLEEISCLAYDNTERKEIDRKVRDALKEKEVLLQEVHHRVKNNLQVISSILNLQSSYVTDPKTLEILQESQNRIKSMSFIHETLYRTIDFSSIDFSEYMRTLSNNLIQSYRLEDCQVHFTTDLDPLTIHIDQAIPCGLIVNELISNALKYAFKGRKEGDLHLSLKRNNKTVVMRVADNGVGLPEGFNYEKTDSLGVQLVYTLTEQIDGSIAVNTASTGTEFLITFEMR
jgi:PAS domain S-box-containing protein